MSTAGRVIGCLLITGCTGTTSVASGRGGSARRVLDAGCGGAYATVQDAIDDALDGDIVEICGDVHAEHLSVVGKALTLRGVDGAEATIIDAQGLDRALWVSEGADLTIEGVTLQNGFTDETGGNLGCAGATLHLLDVVLAGGAAANGGGIGAAGCTGEVQATTLTGNTARWNGGGAWIDGHTLDLVNATVLGNGAAQSGGGLFLRGDGHVRGCTFDANHAALEGGGLYVDDGAGTLEENRFAGNSAGADGGGAYLAAGANVVHGNTFVSNDAGDEGGGLRIKLSWAADLVDNVFTANHASYRGGGAKISHGAIRMTGDTWVGNSAWQAGALVLVESDSVLTGEHFEGNRASEAGAIQMIAGWAPTILMDSVFVANAATSADGGHLFVNKPGQSVEIVRTTFQDGFADERGGAIYALDTALTLTNVIVHRNAAETAGGGLYLDDVTGSIEHAVIGWNDAPSGAAVAVENGATPLEIRNAFVGFNTGAAAIRVGSGAVPAVTWSDLWANAADVSGMPGVVGVDGNVAMGPRFRAPQRGNFRLRPTSPLVDAGDPAVSDRDGSRADIGAFGGPEAR